MRRNAKEKVFAVINFSDKPQTVTFKDTLFTGDYKATFGGGTKHLDPSSAVELKPWGYEVFVQ